MSTSQYDVFLCHNSKDKKAVDRIRELLQSRKITCFIDKHNLEPFQVFEKQLEEAILQARAAAIFLGKSGWGSYQLKEIDAFTKKLSKHPNYRIGLVILPGCPNANDISIYLKGEMSSIKDRHWIDFYQEDVDPVEKLIEGILGSQNISKEDNLNSDLSATERENRKLRADLFNLVADEFREEAERLLKIVEFERRRIQILERKMNDLVPIIIQEVKLDPIIERDAKFIQNQKKGLVKGACEFALGNALQSQKKCRSVEERHMFRCFSTDIENYLERIYVALINSRENLLEEKFEKTSNFDSEYYSKALSWIKEWIYKAKPSFTPLLSKHIDHLIKLSELL
jgi:hypothetical protein